jgi:hypothetical protein
MLTSPSRTSPSAAKSTLAEFGQSAALPSATNGCSIGQPGCHTMAALSPNTPTSRFMKRTERPSMAPYSGKLVSLAPGTPYTTPVDANTLIRGVVLALVPHGSQTPIRHAPSPSAPGMPGIVASRRDAGVWSGLRQGLPARMLTSVSLAPLDAQGAVLAVRCPERREQVVE